MIVDDSVVQERPDPMYEPLIASRTPLPQKNIATSPTENDSVMPLANFRLASDSARGFPPLKIIPGHLINNDSA